MKKALKIGFVLGGALLFLSACSPSSKQMIIEDTQQVKLRSFQTKTYEYSKQKVAKSSVAALQDLGFIVDKADMATGTVTATKLLKGAKMKMTLVIREEGKNRATIRANAQYSSASSMPSAVEDPEVYQAFFNVLDKAVFFENEQVY
ncbi:hypothetical protein [Helicobacter burdigaliensis]|uniref:hypothetical protein n=1 Tax=Helicobacter burdigaliensis TaxID=2315334 RepID=UPI000EF6BB5C|nr:hypothetical protein [Helicobacter burdigaliensis]